MSTIDDNGGERDRCARAAPDRCADGPYRLRAPRARPERFGLEDRVVFAGVCGGARIPEAARGIKLVDMYVTASRSDFPVVPTGFSRGHGVRRPGCSTPRRRGKWTRSSRSEGPDRTLRRLVVPGVLFPPVPEAMIIRDTEIKRENGGGRGSERVEQHFTPASFFFA